MVKKFLYKLQKKKKINVNFKTRARINPTRQK